MKRGFVLLIGLIFILIILGNGVSASFETGNLSHSIYNQYGPSDYIKGWINISLDNEPSNSTFKDSLENSINLIDLLKTELNQNSTHNCSTKNCISDYSANNGEETKTFNLDNRESNIIGFKFTGDIVSINSINFIVESDADSSCYNQLEIDFLNDDTIDVGNNKSLEYSTACSFLINYGCFDNSKTTKEYSVDKFPNKHCQRIQLSESPGFKLGAWIRKAGNSKDLTMALYDSNRDPIEGANCKLPDISGEGEVSCNIDFLVKESKDYYVCIYSEDDINGDYKIKGYDDQDGCGFYGIDQPEIAAFDIFAEGKKFAAIGILNITNSLSYGHTFGGDVSDYILEKYGGLDCSANNCVVPIKFISGKDQEITIKDLKIIYKTNLDPYAEMNDFYDLTEIPAKLNSNFQKIYLDGGNFSVSDKLGNYTFSLSLNDEEIFSEKVKIENVPIIKSLTPTLTASAFPTLFEATVSQPKNITKYEWDFGNNDIKITTTNKITYTYNSTGEYKLKLSVVDLNQRKSYKTFDITVNSPKELINKTLDKKLESLNNINEQFKKFGQFHQDSLNSILNLNELEDELKDIQIEYKTADSEDEYNKIMTDLLGIKIPESIFTSKKSDSLSFYADKKNINLDVLQTIGKGSYNAADEDKYFDAILSWNQKNIDAKINFEELTAKYEYSDEPVLKIFELKINKKNYSEDDFYLILDKLEDIKFKENYEEKEESGYTYIELTESKTIVFSTTEDIDFTNLPAFISPGINKLTLVKSTDEDDENISKWTFFVLIIGLLIVIGFVAYIILQEWYKKKYESHLFKSKNSLYNLITYIENAKKRGLKEGEIDTKLKKAGWTSEQIKYVIKKYAGKRTGMLEIPVGKVLDKFKKNPPQRKVLKREFPKKSNKNY